MLRHVRVSAFVLGAPVVRSLFVDLGSQSHSELPRAINASQGAGTA